MIFILQYSTDEISKVPANFGDRDIISIRGHFDPLRGYFVSARTIRCSWMESGGGMLIRYV